MGKNLKTLFRELCRGLEILKARTTFYNSRSNGLVERFHRSLNAMLGKVVHMHQTDWPDHLPFVLNAYNTTVHSATGFSPHFLMFGREQRAPVDVSLGNPRRDQKTVSEYAELLLDRMKRAHDLVRQRLQRYSERMKKKNNVSVNERVFAPGQHVWVLNPQVYRSRCPKWERRYTWPYVVLKRLNDVNYLVQ